MFLVTEYSRLVPIASSSITTLAILASIVLLLSKLVTYLNRRYSWRDIFLLHEQTPQEGYLAPQYSSTLLNQQGITQTPLRTAGKVRIQQNTYQATTTGTYIDQGTIVVVTAIMGHTLVVETLP